LTIFFTDRQTDLSIASESHVFGPFELASFPAKVFQLFLVAVSNFSLPFVNLFESTQNQKKRGANLFPVL
jgi:hypothetical protein